VSTQSDYDSIKNYLAENESVTWTTEMTAEALTRVRTLVSGISTLAQKSTGSSRTADDLSGKYLGAPPGYARISEINAAIETIVTIAD